MEQIETDNFKHMIAFLQNYRDSLKKYTIARKKDYGKEYYQGAVDTLEGVIETTKEMQKW